MSHLFTQIYDFAFEDALGCNIQHDINECQGHI